MSGSSRLFRDIQCMKGLPTNTAMRIFGNLGVYIKIGVSFTAPLFAVVRLLKIAHLFSAPYSNFK